MAVARPMPTRKENAKEELRPRREMVKRGRGRVEGG